MEMNRGQFVGNSVPRTSTKVNITPEDLKTLVCENCQGVVFAEGLIIKTVSPLLTDNGKEGMLPIPAFYCVKCHEPVQKYLPEEFRDKKLVTPT
jgi:hypothetical protein